MKIKVTQEHINNGTSSCFTCPIALAGIEQIKGVGVVEVGSRSIFTYHNESDEQERSLIEYKLPKKARQFVMEFDNYNFFRGHSLTQAKNKCPKPFEFELGV